MALSHVVAIVSINPNYQPDTHTKFFGISDYFFTGDTGPTPSWGKNWGHFWGESPLQFEKKKTLPMWSYDGSWRFLKDPYFLKFTCFFNKTAPPARQEIMS